MLHCFVHEGRVERRTGKQPKQTTVFKKFLNDAAAFYAGSGFHHGGKDANESLCQISGVWYTYFDVEATPVPHFVDQGKCRRGKEHASRGATGCLCPIWHVQHLHYMV